MTEAAASRELRTPLLRAVQAEVPFVESPFARLGGSLGVPERAVIEECRRLSEEGILREISAVLEGSALGYESALVAGAVDPTDVERVAAVVSAHPTVTHNYLREHRYNLWFTIAAPASIGVEAMLRALERATGVARFHALRRTATFKIGVRFDPEALVNASEASATTAVPAIEVGPREAALFRLLQTPLPLVERPFRELASAGGVEEAELLAFARAHLGGAIRRYVGTLRHRKLGVRENGMVVWRVGEPEIERVGRLLAGAPEVSHCYARNPIEGFPYTLYSMVHGPDRERCAEIAAELSGRTGVTDFAVLFSVREFKKARLRYFLPELDRWWGEHRPGTGSPPADR